LKTLITILVTLVLAVFACVGLAYSGLIDVAATSREPDAIGWLLKSARENAVSREAEAVSAPDLSSQAWVTAGANAFEEMCSRCHGAPGEDPPIGALDMSPPPPDLSESASERSPEELFWVIKHGIWMTGMPAWGPTHTDPQLWQLVAFLERLPGMTGATYQGFLTPGGDGHGHQHGGMRTSHHHDSEDDHGASLDHDTPPDLAVAGEVEESGQHYHHHGGSEEPDHGTHTD
jgi:mono/diheme cytochrome c family protein